MALAELRSLGHEKSVRENLMEDLYKDEPNSWLRRTRFSETVYKRPDPSQIPSISITELINGSSKPNSNRTATSVPVTYDSTSKKSQCTIMPTLKSNLDNGCTGVVQGCSSSNKNKIGAASKLRNIFVMFKEVKKAVWVRSVAPPLSKRTGAKKVKSSMVH